MKNRYEIRGDVTAIFAHFKGEEVETLIDTHDLARACEFPLKWGVSQCKGKPYVYGRITISGKKQKSFQFNRWLFGGELKEGLVVDHINGKTFDNRRKKNLRQITCQQNLQNMTLIKKTNKTSGIRGVCWDSHRKSWLAQIQMNKKNIYRQHFDDLEEAKTAILIVRKRVMEYSDENIEVKENAEYVLNSDRDVRVTYSGIKNISYKKSSGKWYVYLTVNKRRMSFGCYRLIEDAIRILESVRKEYKTS